MPREAARRAWRDAILELADLDLAASQPLGSDDALLALLAVDPADEAAHRALIRVLSAAGRPAEALRQYQRCVRALREELDVAPSDETESLVVFVVVTAVEISFYACAGTSIESSSAPRPVVSRRNRII